MTSSAHSANAVRYEANYCVQFVESGLCIFTSQAVKNEYIDQSCAVNVKSSGMCRATKFLNINFCGVASFFKFYTLMCLLQVLL